MASINIDLVSRAVIKAMQDSAIAASCVLGRPEKFDPNSSATVKWFQVFVESYEQEATPADSPRAFGTIKCECFSRSQAGMLGHHSMASAIQDALCNRLIPIVDYEESGDPTIGYLSIYEPKIRDRGLSGAYQKADLVVRYRAEQV